MDFNRTTDLQLEGVGCVFFVNLFRKWDFYDTKKTFLLSFAVLLPLISCNGYHTCQAVLCGGQL